MSLLDTPYYVRHRARGAPRHPMVSPPGPAALNFGPGWGHPHRSSAVRREDRLLDHRLRNMGLYEDEEDGAGAQAHQDVGPGLAGAAPSPPTSPRSPIAAAISAYSTMLTPERGAPLSAYSDLPDPFLPYAAPTRSVRGREMISPQELRRHQSATGLLRDLGLAPGAGELPEVPVGDDDDDAIHIVDPSNPLGARVLIEEGQYVVEAPTPGVPRDRLSLEFVGARRLELVVAPPPAPPAATEGAGAGGGAADPADDGAASSTNAAGALIAAAPSRRRGASEEEGLRCGVRFPADCDPSSASSTYVDGVLRVIVPRTSGPLHPPSNSEDPLLEEAREGRRRAEEARARLGELEASAREAEERLREALRERQAALAEARTAVPIV